MVLFLAEAAEAAFHAYLLHWLLLPLLLLLLILISDSSLCHTVLFSVLSASVGAPHLSVHVYACVFTSMSGFLCVQVSMLEYHYIQEHQVNVFNLV